MDTTVEIQMLLPLRQPLGKSHILFFDYSLILSLYKNESKKELISKPILLFN